ncbi:MAG: cytochrome P460 family protein [Alphaproteobacteria bacterium]|nr:cytochrome P460 family protein [Alphaproteobacteria bacterium]
MAVRQAQPTYATKINQATFTADQPPVQPTVYQHWVFVGSPFILNEGNAPFPNYHNVYVAPATFAHFAKTSRWAKGAQTAKELVTIRQNDNDEASATPGFSGRGY